MDVKYILKIFIFAFLILSFILFINMVVKLNVNVEGLTNTSIIMDKSDAFCENHVGQSGTLEKSCNALTNKNCNSTSCCVWSNSKCVAGSANGPTFYNKNETGSDTYYFQNKCYGSGC